MPLLEKNGQKPRGVLLVKGKLERSKTDKLASSKEIINKFSNNYIKIKRSNSYSNQMIASRSVFSIEELEAIEQGLVDPLKIDILDLASALYVPVFKLFQ